MMPFEEMLTTYEFYGLLISGGQLGLIGWGLWLMQRAGQRRDKQLDGIMKALEDQSAGIRALLGRTA